MRGWVLMWGLCAAPSAWAWQTIAIDGVNDFTVDDMVIGASGSTWYVEHDATNLYFGLTAPDVATPSSTKFAWIYLDVNPGGATGSTLGVVYNTQEPLLPFQADFHFRWRTNNTYTNMLDYNDGSWTSDQTAPDNFGIDAFQSGTYVEFSIPLASLGDPTNVRWVAAMINEQGGAESTFFVTPSSNPSGYDIDFGAFHTRAVTPPITPVPALPVWGLMAMAGLLGAAGVGASRREEA